MWDLLLENIAKKNVHLNAAEKEIIRKLFVHKKYRKHQYIVQEGEVVMHDHFIIKGLARTYRVDEKGQEHILRFTPEDWWAGDLGSFFGQIPTQYNIDCLEETELLRISNTDLETLFEKVPQMNKYFRVLYQKSIVSYNLRLTASLSKTASERYEEFIKRYPQIEQRVPNHQIASYLGITPQSLSRIRNQSMGKGS
jgi:CRP-like cAMP-binding protein